MVTVLFIFTCTCRDTYTAKMQGVQLQHQRSSLLGRHQQQTCHATLYQPNTRSASNYHQELPSKPQAVLGCVRRHRDSIVVRSGVSTSGTVANDENKPDYNPFVRVVFPTAMALLLCNMDRICLSVAIIPMSAEFGWPASMQGVIQSAFLWGYMATQLLGGALADKYGGKLVMAGGIAWFSIASLLLPIILAPGAEATAAGTAAVAAAGTASASVAAILAARCAVGLGEGVALPAMNNLVATYIPKEAKARGLGMCFSGFHAGNLVGLILSPLLLVNFGWRALFYIFGLLGGPLLAFWWTMVPNQPNKQISASTTSASVQSVQEEQTKQQQDGSIHERQASSDHHASSSSSNATTSPATGGVSALTLMSKSATWAIILVNIVNHWGYFIYLNWMPTYFVKALGFDLRSSSFLAFLPWLVMAVGSSLSGVLADTLVAKGVSVTTVRKSLQSVAFLVPAVALITLSQPGMSAQNAVALMTIALGTTSLGQAGFVANMSDIAPKHAGKMFGLCNTFGSLSGIVGVTAVGFIVEKTQSFSPVFQITAGLYLFGTLVWLLLATGEKVFD